MENKRVDMTKTKQHYFSCCPFYPKSAISLCLLLNQDVIVAKLQSMNVVSNMKDILTIKSRLIQITLKIHTYIFLI